MDLETADHQERWDWFRTSVKGYRTVSLMKEAPMRVSDDYLLYTMGEVDIEVNGRTVYSLKKLYMEHADAPHLEYDFALLCFYNYFHWQKTTENAWFAPFIAQWREELAIKTRSQAIRGIIDEVKGGGKGAVGAAKYLEGLSFEKKRKAGRPTKAEKARASRIEAGVQDEVADDIDRIMKH